ncbi:MAG: SRPBCC family protein [Candidatus Nanopelagicales bacterium]
MIALEASVCIDAPAERVWRWLADLEAIPLWSAAVLTARCPHERTGIGAERVCELRGGVVLRERWLQWDDGHSFTYEGLGIPLVRRATNRWTVTPSGDQTLLSSSAIVELKGGPVVRLLEPAFLRFARRTAAQSLGPLKFLIEHDRPFDRTRDMLGPLAAVC